MFLFGSQSISAQTRKAFIRAGDEAMTAENYYVAYLHYQSALTIDSTKAPLLYRFAEAARRINDYENAAIFYERILYKKTEDQFPLLYFQLGTVSKYLGEYDKSLFYYKKYIKGKELNNSFPSIKTYQEIKALEQIDSLKIKNDNIQIKHLPRAINTPYSETGGREKDGYLVYSSLRYKNKNIENGATEYLSQIVQSRNNLRARPVKGINKKGMHNSNPAFNSAGNILYFTRCGNENSANIKCQIYKSELRGTRWTNPEVLPEKINSSGFTATHPAVGRDTFSNKEWLFFVSDRTGGEGGMDIWQVEILENGQYGSPKNAGKGINSQEDEITPYFEEATQQLYFSSNWHYGLGGYDIFVSENINGNWTAPKNLKPPFNSSYNDIYFYKKNNYGYFSSNREGAYRLIKEGACCYDIYEFEETIKE